LDQIWPWAARRLQRLTTIAAKIFITLWAHALYHQLSFYSRRACRAII
jgi:hypothetical protein